MMKMALFALIGLLCSPVIAGTVFACKGGDGVTTFQHTPCDGIEETHRAYQFKKEPDSPLSAAQRSARTAEEMEDRPAVGDIGNGQSRTTKGYRCVGGGKRWIQEAACPETIKKHESVNCTVQGATGGAFSGSCSIEVDVPVTATALSGSEWCSALHAQEQTSSRKLSSSDAAYERNKMKQLTGC